MPSSALYRKGFKGNCVDINVFWGFLIIKTMYLLIKQSENEALREGEEEGIIKIIKERLMPSLQGEMSCHWRFHLCCWASAGRAGSRPLCYLLIGSSTCLCFFHNYNLAFPLASREVRLESHQDGLELRICECKFCQVTTVFFVTSARLHKIKSLKNTLAKRTKYALGGVDWVFCATVSGDVE